MQKKESQLEQRRKMRENKKIDDSDLGKEVSGGGINTVNYTKTGDITKHIKKKI